MGGSRRIFLMGTIRELLSLLILLQGGTVTANLRGLDVAEHRQPVNVASSCFQLQPPASSLTGAKRERSQQVSPAGT